MMDNFKQSTELLREIENGLSGANGSIPFKYDRVRDFLDIAKNTTYLIGGETGSGKSTFVMDTFVMWAMDWYMGERSRTNVKLSILFFSMERKRYMNSAKLVSRFIFEDTGIYIPIRKILGRSQEPMTESEVEIVKRYANKLDNYEEHWYMRDGELTSEEYKKLIHGFAKKHGRIVKYVDSQGETQQRYEPNHPNHIVLVVSDHIGLVGDGDKEALDAYSKNNRLARDFYGFSPVEVMQLNRGLSTHGRSAVNAKPQLSDFHGTSNATHDADVVIAVFDPLRHAKQVVSGDNPDISLIDAVGYDTARLVDQFGRKYYRSAHILKNTYGGDGVSFGCAMHPMTGIFKLMPRVSEMTDELYADITSGRYFTKYKSNLFE